MWSRFSRSTNVLHKLGECFDCSIFAACKTQGGSTINIVNLSGMNIGCHLSEKKISVVMRLPKDSIIVFTSAMPELGQETFVLS